MKAKSYVEEYDKRGNLIEKKEYNAQGELVIHTKKTYNEYNDEIQKTAENFQAKNYFVCVNQEAQCSKTIELLVARGGFTACFPMPFSAVRYLNGSCHY